MRRQTMDIKVELLVGRKVYDIDGKKVGRIEEIRVERQDNALLVEAYLVGASALIDRLSARTLVRPISNILRARSIYSVYEIPWQEMDVTDPKRPVLKILQRDMRRAK
jgi:sporulation protein YlmC with PRC-barrel domain